MTTTGREGYAYVRVGRNGLIPHVWLQSPEEDPEERYDGTVQFFGDFEDKLVRIKVEVVPPEEEKRLRDEEAKAKAGASS